MRNLALGTAHGGGNGAAHVLWMVRRHSGRRQRGHGWKGRLDGLSVSHLTQGGQHRADWNSVTHFDQQFVDDTIPPNFDINRSFGGIHHRHHLPATHRVARLDVPSQEGAFVHIGTQ